MHSICKITALSLCLGGVSAPISAAQERTENLFDRDRNTSVTEREHPEYTPIAIQRSAFLFRPSLAFSVNRAINPFASSADEESDIVIELRPSLDVETTWSRHYWASSASATRRQFFEFEDESVWHWTLETSGHLDIRRDTHLEGGVRYDSLTEARTEAGEASRTVKPIEYDELDVRYGGQHKIGRILLQSGIVVRERDYSDEELFRGGISDQDFRDYTRTELTFRSDYAISPDTALFGRVRVNERDYDLAPPVVSTNRDSDGYTIDAGADFDIRGTARGFFGLGYTHQDYVSTSLPTLDGVSVDARIEWFPTQLTSITVMAARDVREAPFAQSGGYFATEAGVMVDHELRRNIILSAGVSVVEDDYPDIDRIDKRVTFDGGVTYLLNRTFGVRFGWTLIDQERGGSGRGYTSSTIGFSLIRR